MRFGKTFASVTSTCRGIKITCAKQHVTFANSKETVPRARKHDMNGSCNHDSLQGPLHRSPCVYAFVHRYIYMRVRDRYIYIHIICIYTYILYIHIYILYTYIYILYTYIYIYIYIHIIYIHIIYIHIIYIYIYILYIYIHMHVYVCISCMYTCTCNIYI